jgi:hypothetical protein
MAIKVQGTTVISDDLDITNVVDMTVTGNAVFSSTGALKLPSGNTSQQPTGSAGYIRYNSETGKIEYYDSVNSSWKNVGSGTGGLSATSMFIAASY